jgi:hypothetical protein
VGVHGQHGHAGGKGAHERAEIVAEHAAEDATSRNARRATSRS